LGRVKKDPGQRRAGLLLAAGQTWAGVGRRRVRGKNARPGSGRPTLMSVWAWNVSPKRPKCSNFLPSDQKKWLRLGSKRTRVRGGSISYLLQVKRRLGSGRDGSVRSPFFVAGGLWFRFGLGTCPLKIPKNVPIFFPLVHKIASGWVKRRVGLSFKAGQKQARAGSRPVQ